MKRSLSPSSSVRSALLPPAATATPGLRALLPSLALALVSACGNVAGPPAAWSPPATPASFEAHGSVQQVWLIGAEPGAALELVDDGGNLLKAAAADNNGAVVFREVPTGLVYVVGEENGEAVASLPLEVTDAGQVPDPSFYASQVLQDGYQYIETRDGTLLAANVKLPGPAEDGPYPTLLEYSGYSAADPNSPQPSSLIASVLGYAVVGVNMRGTGCSGGTFQFFETLQSTDGYDVVETVAAQPWVQHGRPGMIGLSYPGISQLFVAQLQPPHLAAIAPLSVISDVGRGVLYPGGILNNGFATEWAADRKRDAEPGGQRWSQRRMDDGDQVCIANQTLRDQTPDILEIIRQNSFWIDEVAGPVSPITFVSKIEVPVYLACAWQDEQTGGYCANMLDRFSSTPNLRATLVNGGHTEPLGPAVFSRWMEFLDIYVARRVPRRSPLSQLIVDTIGGQAFSTDASLPLEPERFLDLTTVDQAQARWESEQPIRILFDNGAGGAPGLPLPAFEFGFDAWPIPETVAVGWYLNEGGTLTDGPPAMSNIDHFGYDTSHSQTTTLPNGGNEWAALPPWVWPQPDSATSASYVSELLAKDLVMAGSGSIDLWLSSTARDVDLQVTLSEVRPDGFETLVQLGWLRASRRKLDEAASSILRPVSTHLEGDAEFLPDGGESALVRVELFPFAHAFRAGSRIRLIVNAPGGTRPRWKFEAIPGDGSELIGIEHSAAHASRIVLPVLEGFSAPTPLPPCPALRGQPCRPFQEEIALM